MLHEDAMPSITKDVFEMLRTRKELESFTLVGGTALALQARHRLSEDLDFWLPARSLNTPELGNLIRTLKHEGLVVELATPHAMISQGRINGIDVLKYAQDWSIQGAKVTFFARADGPYQYFSGKPCLDLADTHTAFGIMGVEGILAMKAFVITQRVKSRDLFDLMTLVSGGIPIESIYVEAKNADPAINDGMITDVLTGSVPLDKGDEGLDAVDVEIQVEEIFEFFTHQIDEMEVRTVQRLLDMQNSGTGPKLG